MWTKKEIQKNKLYNRIYFKVQRERELVLKNPYPEFNDIVEYVAKFYKEDLYPFTEVLIMTDESIEKGIGAAKKYIWYRDRYVNAFIAHLILTDILKNNNNNLRILTKINKYYDEAVKRLSVDSNILNNIKKEEIERLSN